MSRDEPAALPPKGWIIEIFAGHAVDLARDIDLGAQLVDVYVAGHVRQHPPLERCRDGRVLDIQIHLPLRRRSRLVRIERKTHDHPRLGLAGQFLRLVGSESLRVDRSKGNELAKRIGSSGNIDIEIRIDDAVFIDLVDDQHAR